jgi:hypothetical protein
MANILIQSIAALSYRTPPLSCQAIRLLSNDKQTGPKQTPGPSWAVALEYITYCIDSIYNIFVALAPFLLIRCCKDAYIDPR